MIGCYISKHKATKGDTGANHHHSIYTFRRMLHSDQSVTTYTIELVKGDSEKIIKSFNLLYGWDDNFPNSLMLDTES